MSKEYKIKPFPFDNKTITSNLLPVPLNCLVVGPVSCGKTTMLFNLIFEPWGIPYLNLYIFSKALHRTHYEALRKTFGNVADTVGFKIAHFYDNYEEIIPIEDCQERSLVVFDDCENEQQQIINDYFARGRIKGISCIYLATNYTRVDKHMIRKNLNFLCIYEQNLIYTKIIYNDYASMDFTFEKFREICDYCWNTDFGFLSIDLTKKLKDGRYMKNFEEKITE